MKLNDWILGKCLTFFYAIKELKHNPPVPPSPQLVAKRFRQLFIDHGVEETRIPRVFPKISLDDLSSDQLLIKKLTPNLISEVAELFKVRSEWLDGVDECVYRHQSCYKQPEKFFEFLNTLKYNEWDFPFRLITPEIAFDRYDNARQPFTLLFVEKIAEIGEDDIYRYYLDEGWSWSHYPCRIQLKAMAMLYWKNARHPITLHTVPRDIYFQIEGLRQIPYPHLRGALISNPSVEDYISDPKDSVVAKDFDELPEVYKYILEHKLSEIEISRATVTYEYQDDDSSAKVSEVDQAISRMNSKNAKARYIVLDNIKKDFINFYASNQLKNRKASARTFFDELSDRQKIQLVPTYDARDPNQSREKAVRTLTSALRETVEKNPKD